MVLQGIGLLSQVAFMQSLTVTPEILVEKAEAVRRKVEDMQRCFTELDRCLTRTRNYWKGEAGDAHRENYENKKEDIDEIFKRLNEDVADMIQMAGVYTSTERKVTEIASDLPHDVIV